MHLPTCKSTTQSHQAHGTCALYACASQAFVLTQMAPNGIHMHLQKHSSSVDREYIYFDCLPASHQTVCSLGPRCAIDIFKGQSSDVALQAVVPRQHVQGHLQRFLRMIHDRSDKCKHDCRQILIRAKAGLPTELRGDLIRARQYTF